MALQKVLDDSDLMDDKDDTRLGKTGRTLRSSVERQFSDRRQRVALRSFVERLRFDKGFVLEAVERGQRVLMLNIKFDEVSYREHVRRSLLQRDSAADYRHPTFPKLPN